MYSKLQSTLDLLHADMALYYLVHFN